MGDEGRGAEERSEMDGPFVTSSTSRAKGVPRVRPPASRWSDPAPTSGVWDPRGPTPEERRKAYDRQLGWGRWFGGLFLVLGISSLVLAVQAPADGHQHWFHLCYGVLLINTGMSGLVIGRGARRILGDDPEEAFDDVAARGDRYYRHAVYPALAVTNVVVAASLGVALPRTWPVALVVAVVGIGFGLSWRRSRRDGSAPRSA